jgi:hypothetical protein
MSTITSYGNGKYAPSRGRGDLAACTARGCGGEIVRHSLGCGMAVGRCPRCFASYELSAAETRQSRSGFRRFLHEIVSWREED